MKKNTTEYLDFTRLSAKEREGEDYRIIVKERISPVAIVVPHGGGIEQGTSEIGEAIAAEEFSLYCFEGLKSRGNSKLHIASNHFDEPLCLKLVRNASTILTIHGCEDEEPMVYVGGLNVQGIEVMVRALCGRGFQAVEDDTNHSGKHIENICNSGIAQQGVQLEISLGLRKQLFLGLRKAERKHTRPKFREFVGGVRSSLDLLIFSRTI